ncbi:hypothetical protein ASPSYDRAFT_158431 [Aspergillus sydowii CBS 593.65]|uniref:Calcineurin-like phosphoesterase domain-containing protein n=1 Tax=Aspergillus sydowii CBS 593.65 TaxID=1036612 RepID=A0A1L9T7Z9_9EURO|nr:uncharacterized protein ASPSYDRAFT_158431 [Aspergillus sydowii CBS 593.65]OJJ55558.1 hypothetical protein ASPSYDRAFT_158431 [Aspergillus sydowii CBS 593.65]
MLNRLKQFSHNNFPLQSPVIQILSDLHLEIDQQYLAFSIPAHAKTLILGGDVGRLVDYDNYRAFLQKQTDQFETVFLVLGNHEFHNLSFEEGIQKARELEQEPCFNGRLILLHRRRHDIRDPDSGCCVTVLGCTLWSDIPEEARDIVRYKISDFTKITDWSVESHNAAHEKDVTWLLDEIRCVQRENEQVRNEIDKKSILVVTHHAPCLKRTSAPQHENSPWRFAFGTDILRNITDTSGIKAWAFGHTHFTTEFRENGVRVVSNQRGYVLPWTRTEQKVENGFDAGRVIQV